jgi:glutathione S-transferase
VPTLYYFPSSPFCSKVRMALEEKGLPYERRFVNLAAGAQYAPEFLALNPHAKVPVLVDDGLVVYESTAILDHLDARVPEPPLWPRQLREHLRARQLEEVCDTRFYACLGPLLIDAIASGLDAHEQEMVRRAHARMRALLAWLDAELAGREFLTDGCSAADLGFAAGVAFLERLHYALPGDLGGLHAWLARMRARPSWRVGLGFPLLDRADGRVRARQPLRRPLRCEGCGLTASDPSERRVSTGDARAVSQRA